MAATEYVHAQSPDVRRRDDRVLQRARTFVRVAQQEMDKLATRSGESELTTFSSALAKGKAGSSATAKLHEAERKPSPIQILIDRIVQTRTILAQMKHTILEVWGMLIHLI